MAQGLLPDIFSKLGEFKQSRLLQPILRTKVVHNNKHDWVRPNRLQSLLIENSESSVKYSPKLAPKRSTGRRVPCGMVPVLVKCGPSELLIAGCRESADRRLLQSEGKGVVIRPTRRLRTIGHINNQVGRYASLCSKQGHSVASLMTSPQRQPSAPERWDFRVEPWAGQEGR